MRGAERIKEHPPAGKDWQGDPVGEEPDARVLEGCQLWPVTEKDDDTKILDGWNVFVPPGDAPPAATSEISLPDRGAPHGPDVRWQIDGNVGELDIRLNPKGALLRLKRVL